MVTAERSIATVTGIVALVNPKGLKLEGYEQWSNFSKWATLPAELPERGDRVACGVDASGFVRTLSIVTAADSPIGERPATEQPASSAPPAACVDRDARIMRQAVLNTATAILGSGARAADADAVIALAARLEGWVTR